MVVIIRSVDLFSSSSVRVVKFQSIYTEIDRLIFPEVIYQFDKRGVDLVSDALPFGRPWYDGQSAASNAISYARHFSRSDTAVIRVYDAAGNVIETHEHAADLKK